MTTEFQMERNIATLLKLISASLRFKLSRSLIISQANKIQEHGLASIVKIDQT